MTDTTVVPKALIYMILVALIAVTLVFMVIKLGGIFG